MQISGLTISPESFVNIENFESHLIRPKNKTLEWSTLEDPPARARLFNKAATHSQQHSERQPTMHMKLRRKRRSQNEYNEYLNQQHEEPASSLHAMTYRKSNVVDEYQS